MDSFRLNRIALKNPPPVPLSPMMLDRSCKQVLDLTTREIKKNIEKIILDDKKISPRIQRNRTIRPDQSYFGVDEEYVVKNLEDVLPLFFSTNSSDESRRYCESVCEFSRLIARETVKKINNRMALIFKDSSEGSCDLPDTLQKTISLIGNITNCLRTSSTTDSQEEDQDLHEHRGISHLRKSEEIGKSDDGSSGDESSDDEHSDHGNDEEGDSEVECSDDGNGPPLVATKSINHYDEEDQDPQEDLDKESRVLSHSFSDSEDSLDSDDENSGDGSSEGCGEEDQDPQEDMEKEVRVISHSFSDSEDSLDSDDESSDDESSEDGSGDAGKCDAKKDPVESLCKTSVQPRQASEVQRPCEPRKKSTPNLDDGKMASVIAALVMHTVRKAKAPPSLVDGRSLINNLIEKAKQEIKPDKKISATLENEKDIHKALFKVLLKKVGNAREILQIMELQMCDCVFIDELRTLLMSPPPKKKGSFRRFFSSVGKLLRRPFRT
ncbi:unnamed protein product [Pleuronectes platessa]|uniref:Uncharacterized protein n=1 Tax=Pleuronectes platessa TaxID=8262 RepID=A0A9N7YD07_PLEPL|nr:unnamed protein product [Pleuronectes platessa]